MEKVNRERPWPPRVRSKGKGKAKSTSFEFPPVDVSAKHQAHFNETIQSEEEEQSVPFSTRLSATRESPAIDSEASLVTNENRGRYVKDYIFWLTDKSIRPQYEAFARGFYTCLDRTALSIFTAEALQSVVEGIQEIDIDGLEAATRYEDGFDEDHPFIRDFWDVVKAFSVDEKRQLLEFVTASDRVPVNGVKSIMFVIQKNGNSDERLPTSMTCFGRLLLPHYSSKEVLKEKLVKAIENSKGFGAM